MELRNVFSWHLNILRVTLVADRLDQIDWTWKVPVCEVLDLSANTHVSGAASLLEFFIKISLEKLARYGYCVALSPLAEPLDPWPEVALVVIDGLGYQGASSELNIKNSKSGGSIEEKRQSLIKDELRR